MSHGVEDLRHLRETFTSYLSHISAHLALRLGRMPNPRPVPVAPLPAAPRQWFSEAESGVEWKDLTIACARAFSENAGDLSYVWWSIALGNWFRRAPAYLALLTGIQLDRDMLFTRLVADAQETGDSMTLLALLEGVRFSKRSLDFADFSLVQPSPAMTVRSPTRGSSTSDDHARLRPATAKSEDLTRPE